MIKRGIDEGLFNEAIQLRDSGETEKSIKILLKLTDGNPKGITAIYGTLGGIYFEMEDYNNSFLYFNKVIENRPNSEIASLGLFHSLFELKKYKLAYTEMDRFLNSNEPKNYKITLEELFEQLNEYTPEYQREIVNKHYRRYLESNT